jgi:DNA repair photolyase
MRAVANPKNRFAPTEIEWDEGEAPLAQLHIHEERCKSIVTDNRSPDVGFRYSVNPYRGCQHACAYCYARPSHQYWGFGAGTDFEREIIVKVNAPELLQQTLSRPSWRGENITFSGNTDCYQPLEGRYRLTRQLLSICLQHRNPVSIITKSALILRDLDLLRELSTTASLRVFVSIPFADDAMGRAIEPGAPLAHRRFETLAALSGAGIETGVAVAPIIPGLNDCQVSEVLGRAKRAGASHAFHTLLRLPTEVKPVFLDRLRAALPAAASKVEHAILEMRGGRHNDSRFGDRMRGQGVRWHVIDDLFALQVKRLGLRDHDIQAAADADADLDHAASQPVVKRSAAGPSPQLRTSSTKRQLELFDARPDRSGTPRSCDDLS